MTTMPQFAWLHASNSHTHPIRDNEAGWDDEDKYSTMLLSLSMIRGEEMESRGEQAGQGHNDLVSRGSFATASFVYG
jgi:hypothetical protein